MTLTTVIANVIGFINLLIPILVAVELVFFFIILLRYITQAGESGGEARGQIVWGITALFITLSIWGILNVLCLTFLSTSCQVGNGGGGW